MQITLLNLSCNSLNKKAPVRFKNDETEQTKEAGDILQTRNKISPEDFIKEVSAEAESMDMSLEDYGEYVLAERILKKNKGFRYNGKSNEDYYEYEKHVKTLQAIELEIQKDKKGKDKKLTPLGKFIKAYFDKGIYTNQIINQKFYTFIYCGVLGRKIGDPTAYITNGGITPHGICGISLPHDYYVHVKNKNN